jgi:aspartyl-tRNA(Asn)/glutamyl-tRNA(Gln) amidotransferase subunit A
VPIAVKDSICVRGLPATCGSRLLAGYVPPYDATAVAKIREAGAVIVGKTNLDEFAMGSSTENSAFGVTRNPWDRRRVPGGSSGGSAAAVSARMVPLALGSDTGGSVRQPAAFCGVVGMKPTYGAVSRRGLVSYASSLDQIGPIGRSVDDCLLLHNVLCGHDPADATSVRRDVSVPREGGAGEEGAPRIGVPWSWFDEGLDPGVRSALEWAVEAFRREGCPIHGLRLLDPSHAVAAYYIIATAEASSNLARYDGVRYGRRAANAADVEDLHRRSRSEGFGAEVRRRILLGTFVLSAGYREAYYLRAQKVRRLIADDFERAFAGVDAILVPASPGPAFELGAKSGDPLAMYLSDIFTVPLNLYGGPGISVPVARGRDGLPIGMQLLGPRFGEAAVFRAARLLESGVGPLGPPPEETPR